MGSRISLAVLALALCALIAGLLFRPREAPAPAGTAPSAGVFPEAPKPGAAPQRPASAKAAPETSSPSHKWELMRERLGEGYLAARKAGSPYAWLRQKIDGRPSTEDDRRDRVYAFRLLSAAVAEDPALRGEVLELLSAHLATDADPDARLACASTLAGTMLCFHDDGTRSWFWSGARLDGSNEDLDLRTLGIPMEEADPLRAELRGAYARETATRNRMTLVQLLRARPAPSEGGFFRAVLQLDPETTTRMIAVDALGALPPTPENRAALQQTLEGDADPLPRRRALIALISQGAVDELVTARLLAEPPADADDWELLGRAWSAAKPPPIGAYLQRGLDSPDPGVRGGALSSIAATGDKSFLPYIEAARAKESDASLKLLYPKVIEALAK